MTEVAHRNGTQAIERAVALMREITTHFDSGCRLSRLAESCDLRKSTAHRILACLIRERMVVQRTSDGRYIPGPLMFELGLSAHPERSDLQHVARSRLADLARATGSIAYLFYRSGDDFVCSVRAGTAKLPAKGLAIFPGTRRPLTYAAGGAAILLALPEEEATAIRQRNLDQHALYADASAEGICRMLKRSYFKGYVTNGGHELPKGFAVNAGDILPGINAYGLALCSNNGEVFGSISLAGPSETLSVDRTDDYRAMLEETAKSLWARTPGPMMSAAA